MLDDDPAAYGTIGAEAAGLGGPVDFKAPGAGNSASTAGRPMRTKSSPAKFRIGSSGC